MEHKFAMGHTFSAKEIFHNFPIDKLKIDYDTVKKIYPDAVYQYHSEWLGLQSLDVYVPSLRTGFEYQGQQHYQAIEHFGGIEGFEKRRLLDQKKKRVCNDNDVKLIEWRYDEPISKLLLKKKLANTI